MADPIVRLFRDAEKRRNDLAHATLSQPPKSFEEFFKAAGRYHGLTECMELAKALFRADDNGDDE